MRIICFASGSSGNCTLISHNGTHILLDAGISARRIAGGLRLLGLTPSELAGIFITHEHGDHISGLRVFAKNCGAPVFATRSVANHIRWSAPEAERFVAVINPDEELIIGSLGITPFPTPHDTPESVGYRIVGGEAVFGYCTDLGHVTERVYEALSGAHTVFLEANHDIDMLRYGGYPAQTKRRILSDWGHLSNEACAVLAAKLVTGGTRAVILGHISRQNNTPDLALGTVSGALDKTGCRYELYAALQNETLVYEAGDSGLAVFTA